jgi:hypothetical protein
MSFVLDKIRRKQILDSSETVNSDWNSPAFSLDDREGDFSVSLNYVNGNDVDMKIYFQVSNDNVNFGDVPDYDGIIRPAVISDTSGTVIFDLPGSGTAYARLRVEVVTGSIDVTEMKYIGSQRH